MSTRVSREYLEAVVSAVKTWLNEYNVTLYLGDVCLVSLKIYAQMHGQTGVKPGIKPIQRFNIGYIRRRVDLPKDIIQCF